MAKKLSELILNMGEIGLASCLIDLSFYHHEIQSVVLNSKEVKPSALFVGLQGSNNHGAAYLNEAIKNGASAAFIETDNSSLSLSFVGNFPVFYIFKLREKLGSLASYFYDSPSKKIKVIGITGTNGKTTCAYWLSQMLALLDIKAEMIGTLGLGAWNNLSHTANTTPDALCLQRFFSEALLRNITHIAMEVSSHGIELGRIANTQFEVAVFTNLTQDHLDFHGNMENYAKAKEKLFFLPHLNKVVLNLDDALGLKLASDARMLAKKRIFYSLINSEADIFIKQKKVDAQGTLVQGTVFGAEFSCHLPVWGNYNISNFCAVLGTLLLLDFPLSSLMGTVEKILPPPGRLQCVLSEPLVFIDYAHTPDSLEKVLKTLREIAAGKVICVFGCGGNRDQTKRGVMGKIAALNADNVILTDDNPRFESSDIIINAILAGISVFVPEALSCVTIEPNRKKAILIAMKAAKPSDIILIAGKGHETYQEIQGIKYPYSDENSVRDALFLIKGSAAEVTASKGF